MTRFTHYHWYRSSALKQVDDPRHSSHSMLFLYFAEQFWVCSKTEQKVQRSQIPAAPDIHNSNPTIKIPHSDDTFVIVNEPTSLLPRIQRATCLYLLDPTVILPMKSLFTQGSLCWFLSFTTESIIIYKWKHSIFQAYFQNTSFSHSTLWIHFSF